MIGEAVRLIRVLNGKKLTEVATGLGVSVSYLSELENNKKKQPSFDFINKYAEYFGIRSSAVLFFMEELEKSKSPADKTKAYIRKAMIRTMQVIENAAP
ncbi:MAG TPA: helix-turn-helix transcriptional regulator [bacterium]|jgi:transcriptional regulator with XRE-family HTH domain|nr:helix-turn-helix transcriptional regulator [bacterium]